MDTFDNLIDAVKSDITIGDESTLFPPPTVKLAINRAYNKIGGLFKWAELEDAKKTSAVSGQDYYDFPDNWRPDSIWLLTVDGVRYGELPDGAPMEFHDYLTWKEDNPDSTEKKWTTQWRRFFISPTPTTNGTNNICIWGHKVVDPLVNTTDTTIFSESMREVNEAITLEAVAILKSKGEEEKSGEFRSVEAKQIVIVAFNKIKVDHSKYRKIQPMFEVSDYFGIPNSEDRIGNFE